MNPQVALAELSKGLVGSPIDVEAIDDSDDDELTLLPSSVAFPQGTNRTRRTRRVTVDLEAHMEIPPAQTGIGIVEPAAILLSLGSHTAGERKSTTNMNNINYQQYNDLEGINFKEQWKNAMSRVEEAQLLIPATPPPKEEPTFTCPLCFDPIKNPCATSCGHVFCQTCIEACIASSVKQRKERLCPACRSKLPAKKSFHRIYLPNTD